MDRFVETNGIRLHLLEHGGDGPPLILMPGLTGNAHFFDALVAEGLAPAVTVLALDLRGRGLSDKPDDGYTMADHAADVVGLLDALGIARAQLGGHSFGGLLTCYVAATYPDRVARCLVLDAPVTTERRAADRVVEQIGPSVARLGQPSPSWDAYLAAVKEQPYYVGWWDRHIEGYYRADVEELADGSVRPRSRPEHIAQCIAGARAITWVDVIGRVTQPTLYVRTTDPYGPPGSPPLMSPEAAEHAVSRFRDATLAEVPGNHMTGFFGTSAAAVVKAINAFLHEGTRAAAS